MDSDGHIKKGAVVYICQWKEPANFMEWGRKCPSWFAYNYS